LQKHPLLHSGNKYIYNSRGTAGGGVFESVFVKAIKRGPVGLQRKALKEELNMEVLWTALVISGHYQAISMRSYWRLKRLGKYCC
jgi:hypothetical protein